MKLVEPLIAGVRGAENGAALFYVRGTAQAAYWYPDFEGGVASAAGLSLDGNGGAEAYVNGLVDVVVKDSAGVELRRFVAGEAAPAVEVRSSAFTGVDYSSGASAQGAPTTLQTVLDGWLTSAGAPDFNVLSGGVPRTLQSALAAGFVYFNVKDPAYGAIGDGSTDDTSAIQATLAAAAVGGGVVFFPPGVYRTTGTLNIGQNVSLLGTGMLASKIRIDAGSNVPALTFANLSASIQECSLLTVYASGPNVAHLVTTGAGPVRLSNCFLDGTNMNGGGGVVTPTGRLHLIDCDVWCGVSGSCALANGASSELIASCTRFRIVVNTYTGTLVQVTGAALVNCTFEAALVTSGSVTGVAFNNVSVAFGSVIGCRFIVGLGATATGIGVQAYAALSGGTTRGVVEYGNIFSAAFAAAGSSQVSVPTVDATSDESRFILGTRDKTFESIDIATAGTYTARQRAGVVRLNITTAGAITLNLSEAPPGAVLIVHAFNNNSGGVTGTITVSTAVGLANFTVNNNKSSLYKFVSSKTASASAQVWLLESKNENIP